MVERLDARASCPQIHIAAEVVGISYLLVNRGIVNIEPSSGIVNIDPSSGVVLHGSPPLYRFWVFVSA